MSHAYQPLGNNEIRLLTIEPEDADATTIRCSLAHVPLLPLFELPSKQEFKGDSYVWPELQRPYITNAIFKKGAKTRIPNDVAASPSKIPRSGADEHRAWRFDWGDYLTLSYVWGPQSPAREILLDEHPFSVGPNLFDALMQLRQSQRIRQGFKLWVDAICINQGDLVERGQQVARMRDIYASAWQVVIWLGAEENDSDLAFTALHWMSSRARSTSPLDGFYRIGLSIDARPLFIIFPTYTSPLRKEVYKALFYLLTRPYWKRMWILQEVALAREDAPVLCGNRCLPWRDIYDAVRLIANDEGKFGRDIVGSVRPRILQTWSLEFARDRVIDEREWASERMWKLLMEMMDIQRDQKRETSSTDMIDALRPLLLGREAAVTEEKDRIYGILGIRHVANSVTIVPDYRLSLATVYQTFTSELLSHGDLNILRLVSGETGPIYASWSLADVPPLFAHPLVAPVIRILLSSFKYPRMQTLVSAACNHKVPSWTVCWTCKPTPTAQLRGPYRAGGDTNPLPPNFSANLSVTVRGSIFDSVGSLSSFHVDEVDNRYPMNASLSRSSAYGDLDATRNALWRTLVCNTTAQGGTCAPEDYSWILDPRIWQEGVAGVYTNRFGLNDLMWRNKKLSLCGYALEELIFGAKKWPWWRRRQKLYNPTDAQYEALSWAMNATAWRRLVGTKQGRIGLVPATTQAGDEIAVLLGCSTPVVLRKAEDGWKVVGECYVHGVMDGEMLGHDCDIRLY